MISAVVVSLVLVASTAGLPLTTQQHPISQIGLTQQTEKTGVQTPEYYTSTGQATQTVQSEQSAPQQVEKTGYQTPSTQENTAVPKVETVPVNVEQPQPLYPENPVLLPVQPLSVVPFNPTGQVLRPIVVPAEAIADGRVIITPIGSIQQRNFQQDVFVTHQNPEQSQHQEVPHPAIYTAVQNQGTEPNQQSYYVQPVEKQTPVQQEIQQTTQEQQTPVYQEPFIREQQVVKQTPQKQTAYEVPAQVESNPQQVYNAQEVPEKQVSHQQTGVYTGVPIVVETVNKQVPSTNYQTQNVEATQQQGVYNPEQAVQKQVPSTNYQTQNVGGSQQQGTYNPEQAVEKQVPSTNYQTQNVEFSQQQGIYNPEQAVEKQTQATRYTQNERVSEQTQPQEQYQQGYSQTQQTVEKQAPVQYVPVQTHSVQPVQQQTYNVQPEQVENQATNQQNVENVSEQILKTSELEPNQQFVNVQSQQVATYAGEPAHNFGDKLPQVQQHTLSSVPQTQQNSVQPPVDSTQA